LNSTDRLRQLLRRNRCYVAMRRIQLEGPLAAARRILLWQQILGIAPVRTDPSGQITGTEVHLLCSKRDYLPAIWALKSFYFLSQATFPLTIHLQGRSPDRMMAKLRHHFPDARLVSQAEADASVEPVLVSAGLERLLQLRRQTPFMLKLTDFIVMSRSARVLLLDSDVLFFSYARELIEQANLGSAAALFQRDVVNMYNISPERAMKRFGIRLAPCVNSGIALVSRTAVNFARCEDYLSDAEIARPNTMVEQTLYALLFSEQSAITYLPETYLVSLRPCSDMRDLVARHYAGASRSLLTLEGMPALIQGSLFKGKETPS
jgi:hypothetical protein